MNLIENKHTKHYCTRTFYEFSTMVTPHYTKKYVMIVYGGKAEG